MLQYRFYIFVFVKIFLYFIYRIFLNNYIYYKEIEKQFMILINLIIKLSHFMSMLLSRIIIYDNEPTYVFYILLVFLEALF